MKFHNPSQLVNSILKRGVRLFKKLKICKVKNVYREKQVVCGRLVGMVAISNFLNCLFRGKDCHYFSETNFLTNTGFL